MKKVKRRRTENHIEFPVHIPPDTGTHNNAHRRGSHSMLWATKPTALFFRLRPAIRLVCLLLTGSSCCSAATGVGQWRYETSWNQRSELGFSAANRLVDPATGKTLGIVVAELNRGVVCFDVDGNRQWEYPMTPRVSAAPAVGDVDGDGHEDVVAADAAGNLVVLDGHGKRIWHATLSAGMVAESCPVIADLDGDGTPEILAGDRSGALTCLDHTGRVRWVFEAESRVGPVLVADIYDLPGKEIVLPSADGRLYLLGADGRWLWDLHVPDEVLPNSTPVLADVDGSGRPELYLGGGLHHFLRIDLSTRKIVHSENVYVHVNAAITAADLDKDGKDEVIFGTKGGAVYVYGEQGVRWKYEPRHATIYAAPNIVNIDSDPQLEILSHGLAGGLVVLQHDGTVLRTEPQTPNTITTPLLGDLDGDGQMEMVITSVEQGTISWVEVGVAFQADRSNRLTYGGTRAHRGVVASPKRYHTVPVPAVRTASSTGGPSVRGAFSLHGGLNRWHFDIQNPAARQLALLTEVRAPGGRIRRSVRHAHRRQSRTMVPLSIARVGPYRIDQQLLATDQLERFATRSAVLNYVGPAAERTALSQRTVVSIAGALSRWRHVNRQAADGMEIELNRIGAQLDRPLATDGERDGSLTGEIAEVARLRRELLRLRRLVTAGASLAGPRHWIAWQVNPWAHFDARASLPASGERTERLAVSLCVGEYESLALNLTNLLGHRLEVRARCHDAVGSTATMARHVALRRTVTVPTVRRQWVADALAGLDSAGLIPLAPYASAQLWITVDARDVQPGNYIVPLRLDSVEPDGAEVELPIAIRVRDLRLPRPRPLHVCTWCYDGGRLGTDRPEVLNDLVEHGVNVFFANVAVAGSDGEGTIVSPPDFAHLDEQVRRLSPRGMIMFIAPQSGIQGPPFLSPAWKTAFVRYMREWVSHMRDLGIDYDAWAVYPYDEPSSPYSATTRNLVEVAKLIRKADPRVVIYADPTSGTTIKSVEMLRGLIDIWCPSDELLDRLPEMLPLVRRDGKALWFYAAAGHARTLSTLGLYRWRFWHAWNQGFTGVGWWTYATHAPDLWREPNRTGDFYATVYDGPGGPVSSKRWEAARDGVEDYELLYLLRTSIQAAEGRGADAGTLAEARKMLNDLPVRVEGQLRAVGRRMPLTLDTRPVYDSATGALTEAREKLIAMCLRLKDQPAGVAGHRSK